MPSAFLALAREPISAQARMGSHLRRRATRVLARGGGKAQNIRRRRNSRTFFSAQARMEGKRLCRFR
jgi:hypothetical protein